MFRQKLGAQCINSQLLSGNTQLYKRAKHYRIRNTRRTNLVIQRMPLTHIFAAQQFIFRMHEFLNLFHGFYTAIPPVIKKNTEKIEKQLKIVACESKRQSIWARAKAAAHKICTVSSITWWYCVIEDLLFFSQRFYFSFDNAQNLCNT